MLKQEIINKMSVKLEELAELTDTHTSQIDCINEGVTSENLITCKVQNDLYNKIDELKKREKNAKIYFAIDERIDRVVEQFDEKIENVSKLVNIHNDKIDALENNFSKCFNKFDKIDDRLDDLENNFSKLFTMVDDLEAKTPGKNKKYIHYKWEKNLDIHEIREEMCLVMSDVWKGLNLDNATDGEPCDCICQSSINDKYIKVDNRVIKFIKTAVNEKLNKMEDE